MNIGSPNVATATILNDDVSDNTAPTVTSITRAVASPTNAASVSWTVSSARRVTGVDAADFTLVDDRRAAARPITGVTGSGDTYTVTVTTGTGNGTLGLNLVDDDSISRRRRQQARRHRRRQRQLHRPGLHIDKTVADGHRRSGGRPAPTRPTPSPINFTVTFSETVTGFTAADFTSGGRRHERGHHQRAPSRPTPSPSPA